MTPTFFVEDDSKQPFASWSSARQNKRARSPSSRQRPHRLTRSYLAPAPRIQLPICARSRRTERAHRTSPDERRRARHIGTSVRSAAAVEGGARSAALLAYLV
jgi:hypothetical protein